MNPENVTLRFSLPTSRRAEKRKTNLFELPTKPVSRVHLNE